MPTKLTSEHTEVQREITFSGAPFTNRTLRPFTPYTSCPTPDNTFGAQITLIDLRVRLNSKVALTSYLLRQNRFTTLQRVLGFLRCTEIE